MTERDVVTENGNSGASRIPITEEPNIEEGSVAPQNTAEISRWKDLPLKEKSATIFRGLKIAAKLLFLIYLFMCGIDVLTISFKLIGGKNINGLTQGGTLSNPLVGLIVGMLVTVMVQSSSTSTAIIVSLVSSGVINIEQAIPIIMGSNIGTSVTNTFVSFTQVNDRETFRRAFAGATVHDMFNFLCVISLLSLEIITRSIPGSRGILELTTGLVVNATHTGNSSTSDEQSGLKGIITPVTSKIIQINRRIISCWARNESQAVTTLIDKFCDKPVPNIAVAQNVGPERCPTQNPSGSVSCCFLFANSPLSDGEIGIILLLCSLAVLIICLVTLVRVLNAVLQGPVQAVVKKYINSDLPRAPYLTGYFALIVGAIMTVLMQSSSIFTSLLTPLIVSMLTGILFGWIQKNVSFVSFVFLYPPEEDARMGVVSIERCYPLTLGSNIGTTTTALLAAFTENSKNAIQIALVHLFFNIFGILIFYPVPFMRFPIPMSKYLGKITSQYRWFAIVYILSMFVVFPCLLFALSKAGAIAFWSTLGILFLFGCLILLINILQRKRPSLLPNFLRDWYFLPLPLRSLAPYDKAISSLRKCRKKRGDDLASTSELKSVIPSPSLKTVSSLDSGIDNTRQQWEAV